MTDAEHASEFDTADDGINEGSGVSEAGANVQVRVRSKPHRTRRNTRRLRTGIVAFTSVAAAIAAVPIVIAGVHRIGQTTRGKTVNESVKPAYDYVLPVNPTGVLAFTNANRSVVSLMVLAGSPSGSTGTMLLLSPATRVGPTGATSLGAAFASGGIDSQQQAVQSLLQVDLDSALQIAPDKLEALVRPFTPMTLELSQPLKLTDVYLGGSPETVAKVGKHAYDAKFVARLLTTQFDDETGKDLLDRQYKIWRTLFNNAAAKGPPVTVASKDTTTVAGAPKVNVEELFARVADPNSVVVESDLTVAVGSSKLFTPELAQLRLLVAQVMPGRVNTVSSAPGVRLLNPLGDSSLSLDATKRLIGYGAINLVFAATSKGAPEHTEVLYRDPVEAPIAEQMVKNYFRTGKAMLGGDSIERIDLTVVLGKDFAREITAQRAVTTTTSSSISTTTDVSNNTTTKGKKP